MNSAKKPSNSTLLKVDTSMPVERETDIDCAAEIVFDAKCDIEWLIIF